MRLWNSLINYFFPLSLSISKIIMKQTNKLLELESISLTCIFNLLSFLFFLFFPSSVYVDWSSTSYRRWTYVSLSLSSSVVFFPFFSRDIYKGDFFFLNKSVSFPLDISWFYSRHSITEIPSLTQTNTHTYTIKFI